MKKIYFLWLLLAVLVSFSTHSNAQTNSETLLFSTRTELLNKVQQTISNSGKSRTNPLLNLTTPDGMTLVGKVNYNQAGKGSAYVIGEISGMPSSSFHLKVSSDSLAGSIIMKNTMKAYSYYSDKNGNAYVKEVDINDLICVNMEDAPEKAKTGGRETAAISPAMLNLQSLPGAAGCVLLDFDGQYVSGTYWNNGNPIDAAPSGMSDAEIQEHWEIVAEDFRPFNVNITTSEAVFNSYPKNRRMRCIVTPTNTAAPGAGGVAYVGSFNWNDDTPCWVFITSGKAGGEASSHEIGHTFGLGHDGRTNPSEGYFTGHGNWAPIMGVGYYKSITQWSRGEYNAANNLEDDLAKIASSTYGVGYRADDHGNNTSSSTALVYDANGNLSSSQNKGIIERTSDVDYFSFSTSGGNITLNVNTVSRHSDLDILVRLFTQSGAQIGSFNPAGLSATVTANLSPGNYYISVDGTGAGNPATDGYSDYASLGSYFISGNIPPSSVQGVAVLYKDCNYGGYARGLAAGDYTLSQLNASGILDNDISSLKVNSGFEVVLYENDNFSGASITINGNNSCLVGNGWNDRATSLRIRTSGVTNLSGIFHLQNRNSGLYLDVSGPSTADGANIIQWNFTGAGNQQFEFSHLGNGVYRITPVHSGKSLDIDGVSTADGANLHQWTYVGGANQQFIVQSTGDGYYKLVAKHSSKILEVVNALTTAGANVQQWPDNGQSCGQWKLIPITNSPSFSTTIQAESYSSMAGVQTENTTDVGGGLNVGWIEAGDWMAYNSITIPTTGSYKIEYRVASPSGGQLSLDLNSGATVLGNANIPATGGWQNWTTVSQIVTINAGTHNFGIYAQTGGWNINWFRITATSSALSEKTVASAPELEFGFYPNPAQNEIHLISTLNLTGGEVRIFNETGVEVYKGELNENRINVSTLKSGLYIFVIVKDGQQLSKRFVKN